MDVTILAVIAVLVIVVVSAVSPRIGIAAPLALVAAGVALSLVPGVPRAEVEPELILAGVLPPLLYSAAVNMPVMDFRRDLKWISGLSITLVVGSATLIGFLVEWFVPGLGFAEGFALGAIVSPTDAVATSIVKKTGVAPRLVTVLEGESMINDASALVLLRSAVGAMGLAGGGIRAVDVGLDLLWAVVGAIVVGTVVGGAGLALRAAVKDATLQTAISFVVPFVAYVPAERIEASGLVAVVTAGLVTGYRGTIELRPQDRIAEAANWRTVAFLLESGVFLLMGMELLPLVEDFRDGGGNGLRLLVVSVGCLLVLWVVRGAWVALMVNGQRRDLEQMRRSIPRLRSFKEMLESPQAQQMTKRRRERAHLMLARREADMHFYRDQRLGRRDGVVLAWAGMRGAVTLAAAQTLPADTAQRELLVLAAFVVAVSSLVVQGGTLAWVVGRLGVESGRRAEMGQQMTAVTDVLVEIAEDRCDEVAQSGLDGREIDELAIRRARVESRPDRATAWAGDGEQRVVRVVGYRDLRRAILADQRDALVEMRSMHRFDSDVLEAMLQRLDRSELAVETLD